MIDVSLQHIANIVVTCNMLHNMCTINKNERDKEWIDKVEKETYRRKNNRSLR